MDYRCHLPRRILSRILVPRRQNPTVGAEFHALRFAAARATFGSSELAEGPLAMRSDQPTEVVVAPLLPKILEQ